MLMGWGSAGIDWDWIVLVVVRGWTAAQGFSGWRLNGRLLPPTPNPQQLKALVEEGKSLPKYSDPPLDGRPKPIVDAGRDGFY